MPGERGLTVKNLRAWRLRATLTQGELAERAGLARATVSRAESGGTISIPHVRQVAAALGITPEQLRFTDPDEETAEARPKANPAATA